MRFDIAMDIDRRVFLSHGAFFVIASVELLAPRQTIAQSGGWRQINVPYRDARTSSRDAVQTAAAQISSDAQTIVLYNPTESVWVETVKGIQRSMHEQESLINGMILASGVRGETAFYADGQLTATILDPEKSLETASSDVRRILREDHEWMKTRGW